MWPAKINRLDRFTVAAQSYMQEDFSKINRLTWCANVTQCTMDRYYQRILVYTGHGEQQSYLISSFNTGIYLTAHNVCVYIIFALHTDTVIPTHRFAQQKSKVINCVLLTFDSQYNFSADVVDIIHKTIPREINYSCVYCLYVFVQKLHAYRSDMYKNTCNGFNVVVGIHIDIGTIAFPFKYLITLCQFYIFNDDIFNKL